MQALARLGGQRRETLEAHRRIHQITQDHSRRFRFAIEKQCGRLVKKSLAKSLIAPDARRDRLLEVASKCHWGLASYRFLLSCSSLTVLTAVFRSGEHTSGIQSHSDLVCPSLFLKKKTAISTATDPVSTL